ncbi:MAG: hypothetical protein DI628_03540 [Blastochloris viridis]|uniref:Phage tail protein n=1 Tax=Blastochloris viridis TaxID=1079 RepID=A0A6N4R5H5_BLAVI|nr:MAG: hypothetical protein DI628_03540 [Blastochloris viridis]
MSDLGTLQSRLADAETARHKLLTGTQEVTVNLHGFGSTTYTQANVKALDRYIAELRMQIARLTGGPRRGPILFKF